MNTAQLTLVRQPFDHPDFLFELKHDGFRALEYITEGRCELVSRRRNPYKSFEQLRNNLAGLQVNDAIIDGEIVGLDSEGRSISGGRDFHATSATRVRSGKHKRHLAV